MTVLGRLHPRRRLRRLRVASEVVLRPVSAMRPGQVLACSVSLVAAGVLLTRGFIGVVPGRPVFVVLGILLGVSAVVGLAIDQVEVRASRQRPEHALIDEIARSRRFGHALALVSVPCTEAVGHRVVVRMRNTDRAWRHRGDLVVLMPETDEDGATRFARRIADLVPADHLRAAVFPTDAVTVDGLYEALRPLPGLPLAMVDHPHPGTAPAEPLVEPQHVGAEG